MPTHEYVCPNCGVTLQAAQDVAGRKVRCLGCQSAFIAQTQPAPSSAPPPVPVSKRTTKPTRPKFEEETERPAPYLPPIPRKGKFPAAIFVVAAALMIGVGLTVFLIVRFKAAVEERDQVVAQAKEKEKPQPKAKTTKNQPPPAITTEPFVAPMPEPPVRKAEEEEEGSTVKPEPTPKETVDPKLPDIKSILPKLPGAATPTPKPEPMEERPATPTEKPPVPEEKEPVKPAPAPMPKSNGSDSPIAADGSIPLDRLNKLKASTVFIKVQSGNQGASGSGFVLTVTGDSAHIVTNQHVVHMKSRGGAIQAAEYEVVFHSGQRNEFRRKAELVAADEEHDLAILRVSGVKSAKDFPEPLNTTDRPSLAETTPIFVIGFPFGEGLSFGGGNPTVTISKGIITSLRLDDVGDTAFIQIDGDSNPGNSGGPVVDGSGRLVGVLKGGKKGTKINFAIPYVELKRMLMGRVTNLSFRIARNAGNTLEMDVQGDLVDPLGRVKSSSLRVVRADALKDKPSPGGDSKWSALPKAEKVDFAVRGNVVTCRVSLPVREQNRLEFFFQPACIDREGKTNYFAPVKQSLELVESGKRPQFGPGAGPGTGGPPGPGAAPPMGPVGSGMGVPGEGPPSIGPRPPGPGGVPPMGPGGVPPGGPGAGGPKGPGPKPPAGNPPRPRPPGGN